MSSFFTDDTSAAILTAGLLGAQYIGLEPGGEDDSDSAENSAESPSSSSDRVVVTRRRSDLLRTVNLGDGAAFSFLHDELEDEDALSPARVAAAFPTKTRKTFPHMQVSTDQLNILYLRCQV